VCSSQHLQWGDLKDYIVRGAVKVPLGVHYYAAAGIETVSPCKLAWYKLEGNSLLVLGRLHNHGEPGLFISAIRTETLSIFTRPPKLDNVLQGSE
jgi:hypothetical protein